MSRGRVEIKFSRISGIITFESYDTIAGTTGLEAAATRMAGVLLSQYAVTYERLSTTQGQLQVGVAGAEGTRVLAPSWSAK